MKHIYFHSFANKELLAARDYYDDLIIGLGESFVGEVERCLNVIKDNAEAFPIIKDNIRKAVILKFPYSILYRIEKENIYILAVMHQKREPNYWSDRI